MRNTLLFVLMTLFCVLYSCSSDSDVSNEIVDKEAKSKVDSIIKQLNEIDTTSSSITAINTAPVKPKSTVISDSIETRHRLRSLFSKLGCCREPDQRIKACCCEAVVVRYTSLFNELINTNPEELAIIRTTDPFLGDCIELTKWKNVVDAIENPPSEEDGIDDLF